MALFHFTVLFSYFILASRGFLYYYYMDIVICGGIPELVKINESTNFIVKVGKIRNPFFTFHSNISYKKS